MSVTVLIKSSTQTVDDFGVDCELSWTIGRLKEILEESYPNNPIKESQKLIYGGKLLPDHLSLKCVLNSSQERHIIHLVCPLPFKEDANKSKQAAPQSFPVPPLNPGFAPLDAPSLGAMPGMTSVPSISTADSFQQYLAIQQMYAQFMTQYLSQYNVGVPPVPYAPTVPVPQTQPPQGPDFQRNLLPNRPQLRAIRHERDYLDCFYTLSRVLLLFAALYYYSSLNRICYVLYIFICVSAIVKIVRQFQHRQQEQQRTVNDEPRTQSASTEAPANVQSAENDEDVSSSPAESDTNDTASEQTEQSRFKSAVATTVSLISSFFSSLIPSDPVPVNVN